MANPQSITYVENTSLVEVAYSNRPAIGVSFTLWAPTPTGDDYISPIDLTTFQYILASNRQSYVPSNTDWLTGWSLTGAYYSTLYVTMVRNSATSFTVNIYADAIRSELLVTGTAVNIAVDPVIVLNAYNNNLCGISGSVTKNLTDPGSTQNFTLDDSSTWVTATNINTDGQHALTSLPVGISTNKKAYTRYWDIYTDLPDTTANYQFRFGGTLGTYIHGSSVDVLKQTPTFTLTLPAYTAKGSSGNPFIFTMGGLTGTWPDGTKRYRVAESLSAMQAKTWSDILVGNTGQIVWGSQTQELKTIYVEVSDKYANRSIAVISTTTYHTTPPADVYLELVGSTSSNYYTGFTIDSNGRFDATDAIFVKFSATSATDLTYHFEGDLKDLSGGVTPETIYDEANKTTTLRLAGNILGTDVTCQVKIVFTDESQLTSSITKTIRFNTKLYRVKYPYDTGGYLRNLSEPTSEYDILLTERTLAGTNVVIPRTNIFEGQYVRKWRDIFYPLTHRYPVLSNGEIDTSAAIAMNQTSNSQYDAVLLSAGAISYDSQGRVTTVDWIKNGTKNYENMEGAESTGLHYWVVDNTGYGSISLEFEHFYVDSTKNPRPPNYMNPHTPEGGDCVVVYDASATGCVKDPPTYDSYGYPVYELLDATKLVELYAYTGIGDKVYNLSTGASVNASTNGAFTTPAITTTTKILVAIYSDSATTSYGFKIKAGPRYQQYWTNFEVDYENGEIWLHKYPTGSATTNELRVLTDYYDTKVTKNYEAGIATFEVEPSGVISADYSYYNYGSSDIPESRMFASYNDDYVEYLEANAYVVPSGITPNKNVVYVYDMETYQVVVPSGKLTTLYTIDKDRGILQFTDASASGVLPPGVIPSGIHPSGLEYAFVPKGRMFIDYNYHTYLRLSNDGYGNFTFYDETLVGDSTPQYPDYTYGDLKIVNEGDSILEDGRMRFVARGYSSDGQTIDQAIDINRPWDIQQGTADETYNKCAAEISTYYMWNATCSKSQAMSILGSWQNRYFGFDVYPQQVFYGRAVWVLGGPGGSSYPVTTAGKKCWSSEMEGKYYNIQT